MRRPGRAPNRTTMRGSAASAAQRPASPRHGTAQQRTARLRLRRMLLGLTQAKEEAPRTRVTRLATGSGSRRVRSRKKRLEAAVLSRGGGHCTNSDGNEARRNYCSEPPGNGRRPRPNDRGRLAEGVCSVQQLTMSVPQILPDCLDACRHPHPPRPVPFPGEAARPFSSLPLDDAREAPAPGTRPGPFASAAGELPRNRPLPKGTLPGHPRPRN
jgi:hypothetical protein